jgi:hypothetical protein
MTAYRFGHKRRARYLLIDRGVRHMELAHAIASAGSERPSVPSESGRVLPFYDPEDGTITVRIEDASPEDLRLAYEAIGPNVRYGGLLACCLAGIYAERIKSAPARTQAARNAGSSTPEGT